MTNVNGHWLVMVSTLVLQLLSLFSQVTTSREYLLLTGPQSPMLEIGTNFTATCWVNDTTGLTVDDLYWKHSRTVIAEEHYTKINRTTLSVTIPVTATGEKPDLLLCRCKEKPNSVQHKNGRCQHGIFLTKGYRPAKPKNISCQARQDKLSRSSVLFIPPTINCTWEAAGPQTSELPVTYTLNVVILSSKYSMSTTENSASVTMDIFPNHMLLDISVEAENKLDTVESEHLIRESAWFVKTNPPSHVRAISEDGFPTSLLINWTHPIPEDYLRLIYEIRFCAKGSSNWDYVPFQDTAKYIQSFRLQNLQADTVYITQVRCQYYKDGQYWSDWSSNVTKRTPEDRPTSKPDLWRIISSGDGAHERLVQFICKDPVPPNGRIKRFDLRIQELGDRRKDNVKNASAASSESVYVNRSHGDAGATQREITAIKEIRLADNKAVKVFVTAVNTVGRSPEAELAISTKAYHFPTVKELKVWPEQGQMWVEWTAPSSKNASEFVVEWVSVEGMDWQRESRGTRRAAIKGSLKSFVCYNISVYPVFYGWVGKPTTMQAYLEEGVPSKGPVVEVSGKPGRNQVDLVWNEMSLSERRGFITNYTIYYTNGTNVYNVTVPGNITSYTLQSLVGDTKYDTWIRASTIKGSTKGFNHSFTTQKYAPGEIEGIVAGVSAGFFLIVVVMMLLCCCKEDVIKRNCWPWIPNPGESTIGNWAPDYPLKVETPKENHLSGICVLDVDECEGKSVLEEDKVNLPLKRDKYLSEEHSSGIGGSSCMSSPRQSVSDSDEGGDLADTTASTVQYSSVVASSGYKGQTPTAHCHAPQQQVLFSRSESTQPLLDSEESADAPPPQDHRRTPRRQPADQQEALEPLDFCPLVEDCEQSASADGASAEWIPAAALSNYMPQLGGYRPQ